MEEALNSRIFMMSLMGIASLLRAGRLLTLLLTGWQHLNSGSSALDGLPINLYCCGRNLESSFCGGYNRVCKGCRTAHICMAVRHGETARATGAGTVKDVESLEVPDLEVFYVLRVCDVTDANPLACLGLRGSLNLERNLRKDRT